MRTTYTKANSSPQDVLYNSGPNVEKVNNNALMVWKTNVTPNYARKNSQSKSNIAVKNNS